MKYTLSILFVILFSTLWSQDWDTVYTDDKDGTIKMIEVEFPNDCVKSAIEKSIQITKKWKTAYVDNEKVDVYVYTFLIVD